MLGVIPEAVVEKNPKMIRLFHVLMPSVRVNVSSERNNNETFSLVTKTWEFHLGIKFIRRKISTRINYSTLLIDEEVREWPIDNFFDFFILDDLFNCLMLLMVI